MEICWDCQKRDERGRKLQGNWWLIFNKRVANDVAQMDPGSTAQATSQMGQLPMGMPSTCTFYCLPLTEPVF